MNHHSFTTWLHENGKDEYVKAHPHSRFKMKSGHCSDYGYAQLVSDDEVYGVALSTYAAAGDIRWKDMEAKNGIDRIFFFQWISETCSDWNLVKKCFKEWGEEGVCGWAKQQAPLC